MNNVAEIKTPGFCTYRKLVMQEDLNPAGALFGGRIMQWADEAAAMYAMCQLQTKHLVTLKVSEILFKEKVLPGDVLEFWATTSRIGGTSFTVHLDVLRKNIEKPHLQHPSVLSCEFVFVTVDGFGKAIKHRLAEYKGVVDESRSGSGGHEGHRRESERDDRASSTSN